MRSGPYTPDEEARIKELVGQGESDRQIAKELERSRTGIRDKRRAMGLDSQAARPLDVPCYDQYLCLDGDLGGGLVIGCDAHAPATDWPMAERLARIGRKYLRKPRRLVLVGDLFNFDVFSKFDALVPQYSLQQEIDGARCAADAWLDVFDEITLTLGNHDYRLLKQLKGAFEGDTLIDIFLALLGNSKRVRVSVYSFLQVTCAASGAWRFSHMPEYAQTPLMKARKLANRFKDQHVALAHQHGLALGLDESNKYAVVDLPALVDPAKLAYASINDSSKPAMKCGFALLRHGAITVFSDNPALTCWEDWL
jgi:hypothetical protein